MCHVKQARFATAAEFKEKPPHCCCITCQEDHVRSIHAIRAIPRLALLILVLSSKDQWRPKNPIGGTARRSTESASSWSALGVLRCSRLRSTPPSISGDALLDENIIGPWREGREMHGVFRACITQCPDQDPDRGTSIGNNSE